LLHIILRYSTKAAVKMHFNVNGRFREDALKQNTQVQTGTYYSFSVFIY